MTDSVLLHNSLRDFVTKQSELLSDSWSSPERILTRHASNKFANLGVDLRSAGLPGSGLPSPIELEAKLVPSDGRFRLDDDEDGTPIRPEACKPGPEDAVALPEPRPFYGIRQNGKLLPQGKVLRGEFGLAANQGPYKSEDQ